MSARRHVDSPTRGHGDTSKRRGFDLTPNAGTRRSLRNRGREVDGITIAKSCVAFLITVLVLALLAVTALAILTDMLDASRKSGFAASQTPIAELWLTR